MSDAHTPVPAVDDEPKSPAWLPALGAALFIAAGLWWAVTPAPVPPAEAPSASAVASAAPVVTVVQPTARPGIVMPPQPMPAGQVVRQPMGGPAGAAPPMPRVPAQRP